MKQHTHSTSNHGSKRHDEQAAQEAFHTAEILSRQMLDNFRETQAYNLTLPRLCLREEIQRAWGGH